MAEMTLKMLLLGQDVSASKSVRGVGKELDKSEKGFKHWGLIGAAAGAAVSAALVKVGKDAVTNASAAEQSLGATETVFGNFSAGVVKSSEKAAKSFGLSANEYRENANIIGSLLKNQGVASDKLAGQTNALIQKGSDLAAVFGGTTKDAVDALSSAFKGEFDPIERYGISLKQSTVNAEAMNIAHVKTLGAFQKLTPAAQAAAKQQATLAIINKQSANTQGQFAQQTSTTAERLQIAKAQYTNLTAQIGTQLLPVMNLLLGAGSSVLNFLSRWGGIILPIAVVLGTLGVAIWAIITAQKVWTAAQLAFNLVLKDNPIGIVITALALLAAGLIYAYKKSETFRNIVNGAFHGVQAVVGAVVGFIRAHWSLLFAILTGPVGLAVRWIIQHWSGITSFFRKVPGALGKALSSVASTITAPFRQAFNAIADAWNNTVGRLHWSIPGWVPGIGGKSISAPTLPHFAAGVSGVIKRPGAFVAGDGGPEAISITPLSAGRGGGTGGPTYYDVTINTIDGTQAWKAFEGGLVKLKASRGGRKLAFES